MTYISKSFSKYTSKQKIGNDVNFEKLFEIYVKTENVTQFF